MATQQQIAERMVDQLRILDPSISAEVGTPERQIIDTVAQVLAEAEVDLNVINGALDIDAKIGTDLDNIVSLFGFGRQDGVKATGYIEFSRNDAAPADIRIPAGTGLLSANPSTHDVVFITTTTVFLAKGSTSVVAPIQAVIVGTSGNVPANSINSFYQTSVAGITGVTNAYATTGGTDVETDDSLKARFKSAGPFRNLAGTESQYLALAVSTLSERANVIGPISKWKEYIQVPSANDGSANGSPTEYTTALSTNRGAKYVYDNLASFVSLESNAINKFYIEGIDYRFNILNQNKDQGDAYRQWQYKQITGVSVTTSQNSRAATLSGSTGALVSGVRYSISSTGIPIDNDITFIYAGQDAITLSSSTGVTAGTASATIFESIDDDPTSDAAKYRPNVTFLNIWTGSGTKPNAAISPKDILLFEYSYLSSASRNDYERGILNCVDIYVDSSDATVATEVLPRPGVDVPMFQFNTDPSSALYIEKFRRSEQPETRPVVGNILTPLLEQPVVDLPNTINFSDTTFYKNIHYWLVEEITEIQGTIRARNGIEWAYDIRGAAKSDSASGPYSGQLARKELLYDATKHSFAIGTLKYLGGARNQITIPVNSIVGTNYSGVPELGMTIYDENDGTTYVKANTTVQSIASTGNPITSYTITLNQAMNTALAADRPDVPLLFGYPITDSTTEISLPTTVDWPSSGSIIIDEEEIFYTTNNISTGKLSNLSRGYNSTTKANHSAPSQVTLKFSAADNSLTVSDYVYDRNIVILQSALEASKQVTTDILAHKCQTRYFKPDITVIPNESADIAGLKEEIRGNLEAYFEGINFGNTIQLSDIIQFVQNSIGVDSAKWSKDALTAATDASGDPRNRLTETDIYGNSIVGLVLERVQVGGKGANTPATKYNMYFTGDPTGGKFTLTLGSNSGQDFTIQELINAANANTAAAIIANRLGNVSVQANNNNIPTALNPFVITFTNPSSKDSLVSSKVFLTSELGVFNTDVVLKDNELASLPIGKTISGVTDIDSIITIRIKTESTWNVIE